MNSRTIIISSLLFFAGINKAFSQKDSILVTTFYGYIIDNGRITNDKYAIWQKTYSMNNRLLRTVYYEEGAQVDYELFHHYKNNKEYLAEKYKDGSIIGYTLYDQKGKKSSVTNYKIEGTKDILWGKIESKKKKNTTYIKKYNNKEELIYTKEVTLSNNTKAILETYFNNDSLKSKSTEIAFKPDNTADTLSKTIVLSFPDKNDTITFKYNYNKNNILDNVVEKHNNINYTTTYRYYDGGSLKSYRTMDDKRKFYKYYLFDLKRYYRIVPSVKPQR